ncbi:CBS domain-containing protein [Marinobacter sp. BSs20148]|jgi:CBS domain-containing protein|uniref:CBS domain-containing protein n=1 Tax=Marinobacter TaxID=2742 RepID=UPI0002776979|nr:CBS domain-containing protein [Marinobacter sp. BSs20148]AFP29134.1 CBS domain protein [Marinobacter sp. BSs20148]
MRSMNVSDVMWNHIEPVRGEWLISRVVSHLSENHVTGLPVVDSQRKLIGFVSEQDCIHALLVSNYHCEGEPAVREVMILQPVTVSPDLGVVDLAQKLGAGKPKVYPVVDNGKLVGIVTRSAILDHLVKSGCKVGTPRFANSDE